MRASLIALSGALALGAFAATPPARARDLTFLSTQMRPIEEAQRMRTEVLKGSPVPVQFVPEEPSTLLIHLQADRNGSHTIGLVGALHGELAPLATSNLLAPLDDMASLLTRRGVPAQLVTFARLGAPHLMYVPWTQSTYIMAANKKALAYLPKGAKLDALTYDQLEQWAAAVHKATGQRMLGFPAGPTGLMARFLEGYLLPAYTGGVVTTYRSPAAAAMWQAFKTLWKQVNPNSANYNFMQEPLLSGDVWIAWDHVARLQDAFRKQPDQFVAFPAPAGPKGRSFMPVLVGLAVPASAPDAAAAKQVIDYLLQPATQIATLRTSTFFPVVRVAIPSNLDPGLRLEAAAVAQQQSAPDARPALLPVGLGSHGGEFDKVFVDTFQRVVFRGQPVTRVLDVEARQMQRVLDAAKAPCWLPDPASSGTCQVK
jgi:multiple sugar transport system substrate-binding protein